MNAHRRSVLPVLAAALPLLFAVRAAQAAGPQPPEQRHDLNRTEGRPAPWDSLARKARQDDGGIVLIPGPRLSTPSPPTATDTTASASDSAFVHHRPSFGPVPSWASAGPGLGPGFPAGSGPKSYSYMVQVQPHPRSASYRRQQSTRLSLDSNKHAVDHQAHNGAHRAARPQDLFDERPPFTGHTFRSFPFGPFNAPASFTHGNPLAGFQRQPLDGDLASLERPIASVTVHGANHASPRPRRPSPFKRRPASPTEIAILGDARRPNLGIVGVPGESQYEPPPPLVREYDPYTGRFKMIATEDGHDSREAYRRPGASEEQDSQLTDVPLDSYEVYERPEETPSVVAPAPMPAPMRGSTCRQANFLAGLLAPLLNSVRPATKCQAKSERFASLHRPRAPPRRKQVKQRTKHKRVRQREPYFEFRNPVHSYVSGTPQPREEDDGMLSHAVDHDADDADAEYLAMGDAERAALDDTEEQRLLGGHGDENVFAPYSVYRTVLEPDKQFKPSVRYPFEEERASLKDLVDQLG